MIFLPGILTKLTGQRVILLAPLPDNPNTLWILGSCNRKGCRILFYGPERQVDEKKFCDHRCAKLKPLQALKPSSRRVRAWREENPQRAENSRRIHNAVSKGHIKRPTKCTKCGTQVGVVFKHSETDNPLDLDTLCRSCFYL